METRHRPRSGPDPRFVCMRCRHFRRGALPALTCEAFPEGIPIVVASGENEHRMPIPGDHGIRYEPREEGER